MTTLATRYKQETDISAVVSKSTVVSTNFIRNRITDSEGLIDLDEYIHLDENLKL